MTAISNILLLSAFTATILSSPLEFKVPADIGITPFADTVDYRLTEHVIPEHYELMFKPYFANNVTAGEKEFTFDGNVKITMTKKTTDTWNNVTLQIKQLDIKGWTLYSLDGSTKNQIDTGLFVPADHDIVTNKWTIKFATNLPALSILEVSFLGYMTDEMAGFYRSYYIENGQKVWLGTTQFQSTDARKAFPCFDEPGFKATFQVSIDHPSDMHAVSNTKALNTPTPAAEGRLITTFKVTPKMSTYLLAFIVSKYTRVTNGVGTADTYGVVARPQAATANATFLSLDFGQAMLKQFGEALGIDYYTIDGMEKMDTAAIPDFSAGAMENFGLLTYRETLSLYYPEDTTSLQEQRIVAVIAHEQAHQWFGDLVTCKWWSETWLNEGHARYFQYFGTKMIKTTWDLEEQFVVENHQQSMQLDSTDQTHPMTDKTVASQADASRIFDNISYNKAASIIRMMSYYLESQTKFYDVLKKYLNDNKYKAVVPEDYFTVYEQMNPGGEPNVSPLFSGWSQSVGFPMVTVSVNGKELTVKQKRFKQSNGIENNHNELYNLPITFSIDSEGWTDTKPKFVHRISEGPEKNFTLPKEPTKYIILNVHQTGYYRVNYDAENWKNISNALHQTGHDNIPVLSRAQIVDDLFQFARAGTVEYKTAIEIIRYIRNETNYIPWLSAINLGLTHLAQRVKQDQKSQELFGWFIKDTMSNIYDKLEFRAPSNNDKRTDIYNRANILTWACKYGHEGCIEESKKLFAAYKTAGTKVNKDIRSIVYCNAIRYGNDEDFNWLFAKYDSEPILQEQLNILAGAACTKKAENAVKYLDFFLKTDKVRPQDWSAANSNMLNANPESIDFFFKYVTANHVAWRAKFGLGMLTSIAGRFTSTAEFDAYEKFLNDNKASLGDSLHGSLSSSMTTLKTNNLDWDSKKMKAFMDYLEEINGASMTAFSVILSTITITFLYIFN